MQFVQRSVMLLVLVHMVTLSFVDAKGPATPPRPPPARPPHQPPSYNPSMPPRPPRPPGTPAGPSHPPQPFPIKDECLIPYVEYSGTYLQELGNYEGCRKLPKSKYCVVTESVSFGPTEKPLALGAIGVCVPNNKSCSASAVRNEVEDLLNGLPAWKKWKAKHHLDKAELLSKVACQSYAKNKLTGGALGVFIVIMIILSFCVIGTATELWQWFQSTSQQQEEKEQLLIQQEPPKKKKNAGTHILAFFQCFALRHNFSRLLQPVPGGTACLNGMRVISMFWIILGHTLFIPLELTSYTDVYHVIDNIAVSFDFVLVDPAIYGVDSFFWLSGFLTSYMLIKEFNKLDAKGKMPKKPLQKIGFWFIFYFHRYFRLTPVYALILLMYWKLTPVWGNGPLWPTYVATVHRTCDKWWWTNLVYINNMEPWAMDSECFSWGWYMANDFQFFCIVPIIVVLYRYNKKAGVALCSVLMAFCLAMDGYFYHKGIQEGKVSVLTGQASNVYAKPYIRAPAYLWGVLAGFFMHFLTPDIDAYRNDEIEERMNQTQLNIRAILETRWIRWIIFSVGAALCILIMLLDWAQIHSNAHHHRWDTGFLILASMYSRFGWGLGMSIIFLLYSLGYGGLPNKFLSHPAWAPLARMTYTAYLLHPIVMFCYYCNLEQIPDFTRFEFMVRWAAFTVIAYLGGGIAWLTTEKPFMNMEKFILPGRH